jgi:predicted alpha/beta-fold hydrolase
VKGLHHITTPVLVLNSLDDPCCDINNLYEPSKFHPGQTYDEVIKQSNSTIVAITRTGSQCPFLDGYFPFVRDPLNGLFMLNSWADTSIIEYYSAAMEVYDDRRFLQ